MLVMGKTASFVDGGKDIKTRQYSAAKDPQISPVSASGEPSKDDPLQPNDDCHESSSSQQGQHRILRRVWHWSLRNKTIIALVCLVMGGLVAIIVSFGGWFLGPLLRSKLKSPSLILSKADRACIETGRYLSYSRMCACCIGDIAEFISSVSRY